MKTEPAVLIRSSNARGSRVCSSRCSGAYCSATPAAASRSATTMSRMRSTDSASIVWRESRGSAHADARVHAPRQHRGIRQQDRLRERIVLRLREQVRGHEVGIGRFIGDHADFGRPGRQIDCRAVGIGRDQLLGGGHPAIAGAKDLGDFRDRLRAVGHRGDRLRAADLEHASRRRTAAPRRDTPASARPSARAGVHSTRCGQPASVAGTASMIAVEGSGALPAGTYRPTERNGRQMRSQRTPGCVSSESAAGSCAR